MYFDTVPGVRADRLVSLVLLLRQGGQMSASELARELEVSTRTVLRDIEALSVAGVPVYAERGRRGGFTLLPGFRTELTGLNHEETLALLAAGSGAERRHSGSDLRWRPRCVRSSTRYRRVTAPPRAAGYDDFSSMRKPTCSHADRSPRRWPAQR